MRLSTVTWSVIALIVFSTIIFLAAPDVQPRVTETITIKTSYGEVYEVTGTHRCGPAFAKGVEHVFVNQSGAISQFEWRDRIMTAALLDMTRIYDGFDGRVNTFRCELSVDKIEYISLETF